VRRSDFKEVSGRVKTDVVDATGGRAESKADADSWGSGDNSCSYKHNEVSRPILIDPDHMAPFRPRTSHNLYLLSRYSCTRSTRSAFLPLVDKDFASQKPFKTGTVSCIKCQSTFIK